MQADLSAAQRVVADSVQGLDCQRLQHGAIPLCRAVDAIKGAGPAWGFWGTLGDLFGAFFPKAGWALSDAALCWETFVEQSRQAECRGSTFKPRSTICTASGYLRDFLNF